MADQQSTHASLSSAVNLYYEKKMLEDFGPETTFYRLATRRSSIMSSSGKTIEFTRYNRIAARSKDDTSELASNQMYLSAEVITAAVRKRSAHVQISHIADIIAISDPLQQAMDILKNTAVETLDILVRNDMAFVVADVAAYSSVNSQNLYIDSTSNTLHSTGITVRMWSIDGNNNTTTPTKGFDLWHDKANLAQSSTVVSIAKSGMTFKTVQSAVNRLAGRNIPTIDGYYNAIAHPTVIYQLNSSVGVKGWMSPTSAEGGKMNPTEGTIISGVRFHRSTLAYRYPLSGDTLVASSGAMFGTLIFGKEAYGTVDIAGANASGKGFNVFMKESGPQSTNDPTNVIKTAGFRLYAAGKILNKEAGLWVVTTEVV